jgi:poly(3-hydroxybutyrate) depolymerase
MSVKTTATIASFGGKLLKLAHDASTTGCEMKFNLYLPPQSTKSKVPLLIWLSGLTCTGDNCSEKGFFQHAASKRGIAVLYPDTSPRRFPLVVSKLAGALTRVQVVSASRAKMTATTSALAQGSTSMPQPLPGLPTTRCIHISLMNYPRLSSPNLTRLTRVE